MALSSHAPSHAPSFFFSPVVNDQFVFQHNDASVLFSPNAIVQQSNIANNGFGDVFGGNQSVFATQIFW